MSDLSDAPDAEAECRSPAYRVQLIAPDQTVISDAAIAADDDEQAKAMARRLADDCVVELWDGLRFIEHFDPKSD